MLSMIDRKGGEVGGNPIYFCFTSCFQVLHSFSFQVFCTLCTQLCNCIQCLSLSLSLSLSPLALSLSVSLSLFVTHTQTRDYFRHYMNRSTIPNDSNVPTYTQYTVIAVIMYFSSRFCDHNNILFRSQHSNTCLYSR